MPEAENDVGGGEWSSLDAVIECYERDVDRTLIRDRLRLTPAQRIRDLQALYDFAARTRGTAQTVTATER